MGVKVCVCNVCEDMCVRTCAIFLTWLSYTALRLCTLPPPPVKFVTIRLHSQIFEKRGLGKRAGVEVYTVDCYESNHFFSRLLAELVSTDCSLTKQTLAKTVFIWLAFPIIKPHQTKANRKCARILGVIYTSSP